MIFLGKVRILFLFILSCYVVKFCIGGDVITASEYIQDPGSIISSGGLYRLGFFSPNGSTNRYVGIWHNKIPAFNVFWVANREKPVSDSSGVMTISDDGNLVIMNGKKDVLWSSNVSNSGANAEAQLLDSGNLILLKQSSNTSKNDTEMVWESFKNMSDTFMVKMKLSTNVRTNEKQVLTSWKSPSDPSIGSFSISLEPLNIPEVFLWNGTTLSWRSGPWNGKVFIGVPQMESVYLDGFSLVDDKEGAVYLTYNFAEVSYSSYFFVKSNGELLQPFWDEKYKHWRIDWSSQESECDVYGKCGPFGFCNAEKSPICSCLRGFEPKRVEEWSRGNWSSGCIQRSLLQCDRIKYGSTKAGNMDGFVKLENVKVPNYAIWSSPLEDKCQEQCLSNCSCAAYAYDAGLGCMYWRGDLIDVRKFSYGGTTLYVRLAHAEGKRDQRAIIAAAVVVATVIFSVGAFFAWKKSKKQGGKDGEQFPEASSENMLGESLSKVDLQDLVPYKLEELAAATSDFSDTNKLGEIRSNESNWIGEDGSTLLMEFVEANFTFTVTPDYG
ncbi:G-type lectin S-receptor-like serine/threonine-protein kinase At1g11330 [Syzygium oleosum]|uniref:G-type lectin S-receptor-like serine/threonine-protein kinase At1g11330 n=1 Tax=Syzygium oleosum TaxID=219896 RepID=UPI0011D227C1|nr:G-type lectin S-receptor-like serine/threonine-protein kinase At1g11330 [Syzygium oleosum]